MFYYTIYMKNLNNGTGYIDIALKDDQLVKDFVQYLDVGLKSHRAYTVVDPGSGGTVAAGIFSVNLADVAAMTTTLPVLSEDAQAAALSATQFIKAADLDKPATDDQDSAGRE